ncbi:MAG: hypothetical protein AAFW65_01340 [Pseudomonadota bacterium]
MTASQYYSFLTGGLALLCTIGLLVAWLLWRERETRQDAIKSALSGIAPEFRLNLERMVKELSALANGRTQSASSILPIAHPQLNGVNANLIKTDRTALAAMGAAYQALASTKLELKDALGRGAESKDTQAEAIDAAIDAFATLYLWEEHRGVKAPQARSTRSWHVRDWMKAHRFPVDAFPDMHLRDEVVERLRTRGMTLTPRPLTHTAHEYYAMQYDRQADPRTPFGWRRKAKAEPDAETDEALEDAPEIEAEPDAEASDEVKADLDTKTEVEPKPEREPEDKVETESKTVIVPSAKTELSAADKPDAPVIKTAQTPEGESLSKDSDDTPVDPVRQS